MPLSLLVFAGFLVVVFSLLFWLLVLVFFGGCNPAANFCFATKGWEETSDVLRCQATIASKVGWFVSWNRRRCFCLVSLVDVCQPFG